MSRFQEVPDAAALAKLVGIDLPEGVAPAAVLDLLLKAPDAKQYLESRLVIPQMPPGVIGYLVPQTRIFFNVGRCKELWGDAMVAGAVFATTQSLPTAFFAASALKLHNNLMQLNDNEAEVVRDIIDLSGGKPYDRPIQESDLRPRFEGTSVPLDFILDALEQKGVVTKRRDGALLLVF